ncbi:ABC transporter permease [Marinicrinis sediminis]|uniref:ABC transporter permease n=1 Tax=Marinicrinis sediminis TaxID=1652465 RepID=A0ABW5R768_9BACL
MRIRTLVIRILKQFIGDKRTLALMLLAPLGILFLMSLVFQGDYRPQIAVMDLPAPFTAQLEETGADVYAHDSLQEAEALLAEQELDAILSFQNGVPAILLEGSDPSVNQSVMMSVQAVLQQSGSNGVDLDSAISYLHGSSDMASFDYFGPVLVGFFAFFFVFLISGISFLRERTGGTLERLLASPIRRSEIVFGYIGGFGLFTLLQAALIAWFSVSILDMMMVGSFWYVLLITLLLALTALTLGTLLSAFAQNEFQMIQFIPLVVVPQVFFSGLFNLDSMDAWLRAISYVIPLSYAADALREVMIRGNGFAEIATDLLFLLGFSLVFMTANIFALRKHRKL